MRIIRDEKLSYDQQLFSTLPKFIDRPPDHIVGIFLHQSTEKAELNRWHAQNCLKAFKLIQRLQNLDVFSRDLSVLIFLGFFCNLQI